MPELTVLLVRGAAAEGEEDAGGGGPDDAALDLSPAAANADLAAYIRDQAGDERGRDEGGAPTLSVRVDPDPTPAGLERAQAVLTALVAALAADTTPGPGRRLAVFAAPLRTCVGVALMLSCADVPRQEASRLEWRLSTFEGAAAPAALPVVVRDGLCNGEPQVERLAGYRAVADAGLLHCAARPFNDGRTKCPLMKALGRLKARTRDRVDDWDEARGPDGARLHQVTAVQFLRLLDDEDAGGAAAAGNPWRLRAMTPKFNILIDYAEPKKYMLTPRKGYTEPKRHYMEWKETAEPYVRDTLFRARQAGCDTVLLVLPAAAMRSVLGDALPDATALAPCSVASLVATVGDDVDAVDWRVHRVANPLQGSDASFLLPPFAGRVTGLVEPPAGQDPATANPPGTNVWAQFPGVPPEVLPANYPSLPDFCMALEAPLPGAPPAVVSPSKPKPKPKPKKRPVKV